LIFPWQNLCFIAKEIAATNTNNTSSPCLPSSTPLNTSIRKGSKGHGCIHTDNCWHAFNVYGTLGTGG
jgi:hypothetical protein